MFFGSEVRRFSVPIVEPSVWGTAPRNRGAPKASLDWREEDLLSPRDEGTQAEQIQLLLSFAPSSPGMQLTGRSAGGIVGKTIQ